jgi:hypothetical protein
MIAISAAALWDGEIDGEERDQEHRAYHHTDDGKASSPPSFGWRLRPYSPLPHQIGFDSRTDGETDTGAKGEAKTDEGRVTERQPERNADRHTNADGNAGQVAACVVSRHHPSSGLTMLKDIGRPWTTLIQDKSCQLGRRRLEEAGEFAER